MKKAILAVSFGTAYPGALEQSVAVLERTLAEAFPGWEIRRAYTGETVLQTLRQQGIPAQDPVQALDGLAAEGFTHVAVQPLFISRGIEYEKLCAEVDAFRSRLRISVGAPLLGSERDISDAAEALLEWLPAPEDGEALLLMGHGRSGSDNADYLRMAQTLQGRRDNVYFAVMNGQPSLESVLEQLPHKPEIRKLLVSPFLLTPGCHAHRDMELWAERLRAEGYRVTCHQQGLGQCAGIRKLFTAHCAAAAEVLTVRGRLWGVGVGPGDPELLTLKAIRVMKEADVVLVPDAPGADNTAWNIAKDHIAGKDVRFVQMPMVRDKAVMAAAHEEAAEQICALLDDGKQVAFLTLGDPGVYSTYMYVHEKVLRRGYPVEVVPGVPSFCAAAARLNRPLCLGREPLLVIPASHDQEALMDVPANKVFMKAGRSILELQQALAQRGLLEDAAMVENCGMKNERVYPRFADLKEPSGYFSLVITKGGKS